MNLTFHVKTDSRVVSPRHRPFHFWITLLKQIAQNTLDQKPNKQSQATSLNLEQFMEEWQEDGRTCK